MKKLLKSLTGAAIIGAAVGACVYFFTKKKEVEISDDDFVDEFDDEFEEDVVVDGTETASRSYATLNSEPVEEFGEVEDAPVVDAPAEKANSVEDAE